MAVESVVLPVMRGLEPGDLISLSFERGSKAVHSKEYSVAQMSHLGDMTTQINEVLSLSVTMYKDSHGEIQVDCTKAVKI